MVVVWQLRPRTDASDGLSMLSFFQNEPETVKGAEHINVVYCMILSILYDTVLYQAFFVP